MGRSQFNEEAMKAMKSLMDAYEGVCVTANIKPENYPGYVRAKIMLAEAELKDI